MKLGIVAISLGLSISVNAQLNMSQVGHLDLNSLHSTGLNDIWGYVDGTGIEYALVGASDGTSVVSLQDPSNPVEVFWKPGTNSVWRDLKTWNNHAYITTEAEEGLLILDLTSLPNASGIDTTHWYGTSPNTFLSAHNLFIEDNGYCYLFGSNIANGGVRILDLNSDPMNPTEVGSFENWYVHDGVVRNDTMFLGHINDGFLSMVDVSDKANPVYLGSTNTPSNFTHNVWFSDDGTKAFTTDEVSNAYIASYDVSNPSNIVELDKIQSSPGTGTIPHNTHFINDYIVTSYYADGVTIHDVSDPSNMVEVGNFDTSPTSGNTFDGCWGVYPWLPSGLIIASDRQMGLFVLDANYTRACYLEGIVSDQNTIAPIPNASAVIISHNQIEHTDLAGNYSTGIATPGTYDVAFYKAGYFPDTLFGVNLTSGNITNGDIFLEPKVPFQFTVQVVEQGSGTPIDQAIVRVNNSDFDYNLTTNASGYVSIPTFYEDFYDIYAGKWGHKGACVMGDYCDSNNDTVILELELGYADNFTLDLGWTTVSTATTGDWVREKPIQTGTNPIVNPGMDAMFDCGEICYMTGNGGNNPDYDDIDYGIVQLFSPSMDLSTYTDPYINYSTWFFTKWGPFPIDDTAYVKLHHDAVSYVIDTMHENTTLSEWLDKSCRVLDFASNLSGTFSIEVYASDEDSLVNVTEMAFDRFDVSEGNASSVTTHHIQNLLIYPNPGDGILHIDLNFEGKSQLKIMDIHGREVKNAQIQQNQTIDLSFLENGMYIIQVNHEHSRYVSTYIKH